MTNLEMRQLARSEDLRGIRKACGISATRIARVLGMPPCVVYQYEAGARTVSGQLGNRYMRIVQAMRNHLEVPEDGGCEAIPA